MLNTPYIVVILAYNGFINVLPFSFFIKKKSEKNIVKSFKNFNDLIESSKVWSDFGIVFKFLFLICIYFFWKKVGFSVRYFHRNRNNDFFSDFFFKFKNIHFKLILSHCFALSRTFNNNTKLRWYSHLANLVTF